LSTSFCIHYLQLSLAWTHARSFIFDEFGASEFGASENDNKARQNNVEEGPKTIGDSRYAEILIIWHPEIAHNMSIIHPFISCVDDFFCHQNKLDNMDSILGAWSLMTLRCTPYDIAFRAKLLSTSLCIIHYLQDEFGASDECGASENDNKARQNTVEEGPKTIGDFRYAESVIIWHPEIAHNMSIIHPFISCVDDFSYRDSYDLHAQNGWMMGDKKEDLQLEKGLDDGANAKWSRIDRDRNWSRNVPRSASIMSINHVHVDAPQSITFMSIIQFRAPQTEVRTEPRTESHDMILIEKGDFWADFCKDPSNTVYLQSQNDPDRERWFLGRIK
jgi:hypothetical protein